MGSLVQLPGIASLPALTALPSVQNASYELAQNDANPFVFNAPGSVPGQITFGTPIPSTPTTPSSSIGTGTGTSIGQRVSNVGNKAAEYAGSILTGGLLTPRYIYLFLGMLLIGAGIYSFKTTQTIIETGTKAVKTGSKVVAAIAAP